MSIYKEIWNILIPQKTKYTRIVISQDGDRYTVRGYVEGKATCTFGMFNLKTDSWEITDCSYPASNLLVGVYELMFNPMVRTVTKENNKVYLCLVVPLTQDEILTLITGNSYE